MPDGLTWKQSLKQETEKVKKMNPGERWQYFKTYYLTKAVIALVILALLLFFFRDMRMNQRQMLASGCMVNVTTDADGFLFLTDDYVSFCGKTVKEATAQLSDDNTLDFMKENPLDQDSYEMALTAQICAGEYQYMILDETAFAYFEKLDVYADLTQILTPAQQKQLSDKVVYRKQKDGEKQVACAITLSGSTLEQHCKLNPQEAYLVFIDVDADTQQNRHLLEYLFQ